LSFVVGREERKSHAQSLFKKMTKEKRKREKKKKQDGNEEESFYHCSHCSLPLKKFVMEMIIRCTININSTARLQNLVR
jgi:ribosomal protein S26